MAITALDLQRAYSRIQPWVKQTPLLRSSHLSELWNADVYLKCEQFQAIGAFKIRGAANFSLQINADERKRGFLTHSSGNHAQAVAFMAHSLGVPSFIVMPEDSNKLKIRNATRWGANIEFCEPGIENRVTKAEEIQKATGATMIPPFDHPYIVEGQATATMEIFRHLHEIELLFTPLGGGGLLAGSALAAKYFSPGTKVVGCEPAEASDGHQGFKTGKRVEHVDAHTIADGLRTTVGITPFEIIKNDVSDIILAEEGSIRTWMYRIWEKEKLVIEPSCAVPFAAIDGEKERIRNKRIVIVITGGNVDFDQLP